MRALIDTNTVLDFLTKREPFRESAEAIVEASASGKIAGSIAAHSFPNIFFILRKEFNNEDRRRLLLGLCGVFKIEGIDQDKIESAIQNEPIADFEDALQIECAISFGADYIITRDPKGFAASSIPAISPDTFVKLI